MIMFILKEQVLGFFSQQKNSFADYNSICILLVKDHPVKKKERNKQKTYTLFRDIIT